MWGGLYHKDWGLGIEAQTLEVARAVVPRTPTRAVEQLPVFLNPWLSPTDPWCMIGGDAYFRGHGQASASEATGTFSHSDRLLEVENAF